MNAAKQARLESGLNTMAKKVLDAVPIKDPWTRDQVMGELRRGGMTPDRAVIDGCLAHLCDARLVKQSPPGLYIRVLARQITTSTQENDPVPSPIRATTTITAPAQQRAADEVDAIALEVDAQLQAAAAGGDKLRQLKALLSELGA
ncbi:hypothetical protein APR47_05545 [Variovorax paradoxus]|nr:hypothetical protein APR47_05545 [Variovorax paradoxus]